MGQLLIPPPCSGAAKAPPPLPIKPRGLRGELFMFFVMTTVILWLFTR